jgi:hypothetical protein
MNAHTADTQREHRTTGAVDAARAAGEPESPEPTRTVLVIDRELPIGLAANAAAVLALTLGALEPDLRGADFTDGSGEPHPGLFPAGLPVLAADPPRLWALRKHARKQAVRVVDLPSAGQQTNDYEAFRHTVASTPEPDLRYVGIALHGPARVIRSLTGGLPLLR